jgi:hypothetical protein
MASTPWFDFHDVFRSLCGNSIAEAFIGTPARNSSGFIRNLHTNPDVP